MYNVQVAVDKVTFKTAKIAILKGFQMVSQG